MFNILRALLFRLARRPWFWVVLAAFALLGAATALMAGHVDIYEFLSVDRVPDPTLLAIGIDSSESPILPDGSVPALFFIGVCVGRWPATAASLVVSLLVSGDFGAHAIKNLPLARGGRVAYALATMVLCAAFSLLFVLAALAFALLGCRLTSAPIVWPATDAVALWVLAHWLATTCYAAACACVVLISGSRTLGVLAVLVLPSGIVEALVAIGAAVLPMTTTAGIDAMFTFFPFDAMASLQLGSPPGPHGLLACAGVLATSALVGALHMRRKDLGR